MVTSLNRDTAGAVLGGACVGGAITSGLPWWMGGLAGALGAVLALGLACRWRQATNLTLALLLFAAGTTLLITQGRIGADLVNLFPSH